MINHKRSTQAVSQANKERIIELRTAHPEMTLKTIGQQVSLTKERVRQVLVKAELPTLSTGRTTTKAKPIQPCKQCGNIDKQFKGKHAMYCSTECKAIGVAQEWVQWRANHPDRWTTYQCTHCGTFKTIRTTLYKRQVKIYKNLFCSHTCSLSSQWDDKNSALSINRRVHIELDGLDSTT